MTTNQLTPEMQAVIEKINRYYAAAGLGVVFEWGGQPLAHLQEILRMVEEEFLARGGDIAAIGEQISEQEKLLQQKEVEKGIKPGREAEEGEFEIWIEEKGGRRFYFTRDPWGQISMVYQEDIAEEPEPLTKWQQEQLLLQRQQLYREGQYRMQDAQARQQQFRTEQERWEWEKERWGQEMAWRREDVAAQRELEWQKLLASLQGPQDWIKRWEVIREKTPYTEEWLHPFPEIMSEAERERMLQEVSAGLTHLGEYGATGVGPPHGAPDPTWLSMAGEAPGEFPTRTRVYKEEAPPAPAWLSKFVPGQTTGETITKEWLRTPSAQQWAKTPWSQRAGLAGYATWAGGRSMEDILSHMERGLPERPRGAGRERWIPARQRG